MQDLQKNTRQTTKITQIFEGNLSPVSEWARGPNQTATWISVTEGLTEQFAYLNVKMKLILSFGARQSETEVHQHKHD